MCGVYFSYFRVYFSCLHVLRVYYLCVYAFLMFRVYLCDLRVCTSPFCSVYFCDGVHTRVFEFNVFSQFVLARVYSLITMCNSDAIFSM
jgi:hypothetical protein